MIRKVRLRSRAFTLVELLVVIGILLVIAGLSLPSIYNTLMASENASRARNAQVINSALTAYVAAGGVITGSPPTVHSILTQLLQSGVVDFNTGIAGPFLLDAPDSSGLYVSPSGNVQ